MTTFANLVRVRNIHTGQIGRVARSIFENERLNPGILVEVDDSAKPYHRDFYTSKFVTTTEPDNSEDDSPEDEPTPSEDED